MMVYMHKDWHKTMVNNYSWTGPEKDELARKIAKKPYNKKPFRFLDLPVELQKMIIKEYYSGNTIRAAAKSVDNDNIIVFANLGPLLVSRSVHNLAKAAIREAKFDTVILSHYGMENFRRKGCVDVMLDYVPELKLVRNDIKIIKYDFGPMMRYSLIRHKFPNVERCVSLHEDQREHAVIRHKDSWISEDLMKGNSARKASTGSDTSSGTGSDGSSGASSDE